MKRLKPLAAAISGMMLLAGHASAAEQTLVQFDPTGTSTYSIPKIMQFDWEPTGDLSIEYNISVQECLTGCNDGTAGNETFAAATSTTLATYFGTGSAAVDDIVTFDINAQARLVSFIGTGATISVPTLDTNGADTGDAGFEITSVIDATETARVSSTTNGTTIQFLTITGTTTWYIDQDPDSVVDTGAGFIGDVAILTGNLTSTNGTFTFDPTASADATLGNSTLGITITSYNSAYLQTDPLANAPLVGSNFGTEIKIGGALADRASSVGETVGGDVIECTTTTIGGVTVPDCDQVFKADANSIFFAEPAQVPEPGTLFLLGVGLLGFGALARRKSV